MDQIGSMVASIGGVRGIFVKTYYHGLDPKKRLTVPAPWRDEIGSSKSVYIVPAVKARYLNVFPSSVMAGILEKIRNLSIADEEGRQLVRVLGSQADLVPWDSQGRIRINDELLEYAQLTGEVAMVGVIQSVELWNPALWQEVRNQSRDPSNFGDAARRVGI